MSVGHAIGLAQRMESLANPGCVVVSERTYALTTGFFDFEPLGAARVKGVPDPVRLYQLVGIGPVQTPFERRVAGGLSRFVGRESELATLEQALAEAAGGVGGTVAVVGEAGVGKSRLLHEPRPVPASSPSCSTPDAHRTQSLPPAHHGARGATAASSPTTTSAIGARR